MSRMIVFLVVAVQVAWVVALVWLLAVWVDAG